MDDKAVIASRAESAYRSCLSEIEAHSNAIKDLSKGISGPSCSIVNDLKFARDRLSSELPDLEKEAKLTLKEREEAEAEYEYALDALRATEGIDPI